MTDRATRQAQRAVAQDGDPQAHAALLRAQIRAGNLRLLPCPEATADPLRHVEGVEDMSSLRCDRCGGPGTLDADASVALLAWCQHPGAVVLSGWTRCERRGSPAGKAIPWVGCNCGPPTHDWDCPGRLDLLDEWLQWIPCWGREACVRVALAMVRATLDYTWLRVRGRWEPKREGPPGPDLITRLIAGTEAWLLAATPEQRREDNLRLEALSSSLGQIRQCYDALHLATTGDWSQARLALAWADSPVKRSCLSYAPPDVLRAAAHQAVTDWLLP